MMMMWKTTTTTTLEEKKEKEDEEVVVNTSSINGVCGDDMICFMVDQDKMNQYKKDAMARNARATADQQQGDDTTDDNKDDTTSYVDFVSSNDVLTNWFFQYSNCTQGFMAINLRNRFGGGNGAGGEGNNNKITNVHAGNYETTIYYRVPQDTCNNPMLIRQSLSNFHRVHTYDQKPTFYEFATSNFSLITNWSSFTNANVNMNSVGTQGQREQEEAYEYKLLLHMPVLDITTANKMPSTLAVCVIFRPKPNQLGVMIFGDEEKRLQDIIASDGGGGGKEHAAPFLV